MFGYITIDREQMTDTDKRTYQSFYCGLCQVLKQTSGIKGRMLINYDMTFLIVLLSGLYELVNTEQSYLCPLHPTKKRTLFINEATYYAADMNLLFAYQNFEDDWVDERSYTKKMFTKIFDKDYTKIRGKYPRQVNAMEEYMKLLQKAEREKEKNIDVIAGLSGEMLSEIFVWKKDDVWERALRHMGFYMGKFIYLMDAYEDINKDLKTGAYNPLIEMKSKQEADFDTLTRLMLTSMMSECSKSFETLPILEYVDILRNVLYSGVWLKYDMLLKKKEKGKKL
ncbi:DUF5685 family protein [Eubacterium oxidoreducens]|uniref:Uncharacterized protein n=1 Tax=Eubacterium oxidoreducens TaxID=1732 RepID=A0A1G6BLU8_EUBOX|nr:DUF5685 family protein [Eubacterium oxidoreducens]SDB21581.1 hypothetical protein SAMN02910417_01617 [Eubacterium oxidoreducens]